MKNDLETSEKPSCTHTHTLTADDLPKHECNERMDRKETVTLTMGQIAAIHFKPTYAELEVQVADLKRRLAAIAALTSDCPMTGITSRSTEHSRGIRHSFGNDPHCS
jgi:hypothetical protein